MVRREMNRNFLVFHHFIVHVSVDNTLISNIRDSNTIIQGSSNESTLLTSIIQST